MICIGKGAREHVLEAVDAVSAVPGLPASRGALLIQGLPHLLQEDQGQKGPQGGSEEPGPLQVLSAYIYACMDGIENTIDRSYLT